MRLLPSCPSVGCVAEGAVVELVALPNITAAARTAKALFPRHQNEIGTAL
jgi:hypothetical protein